MFPTQKKATFFKNIKEFANNHFFFLSFTVEKSLLLLTIILTSQLFWKLYFQIKGLGKDIFWIQLKQKTFHLFIHLPKLEYNEIESLSNSISNHLWAFIHHFFISNKIDWLIKPSYQKTKFREISANKYETKTNQCKIKLKLCFLVKMTTFPFTHFILLDFDTRRNWERLQNIIVVADQPWKIIVLYQTYLGGKWS